MPQDATGCHQTTPFFNDDKSDECLTLSQANITNIIIITNTIQPNMTRFSFLKNAKQRVSQSLSLIEPNGSINSLEHYLAVGGGVIGTSYGIYNGVSYGVYYRHRYYGSRTVTEKFIDGTLGGMAGGFYGASLGIMAPVWVPIGVTVCVAVGGTTAYSYITKSDSE